MQDFRSYSYTIEIDKLEETAREVIKAGYSVTVIINGEYYEVTDDSPAEKETGNNG